jgi:phosphonate ABC transporter permease subunit PhnE
MLLTYVVIAVLVAGAQLAARGSARRLTLAAAVGVLIAFFMQPLAQLTGAYSRHALSPTALGFSPQYPWLWLLPVGAMAILILARGRLHARVQGYAAVAVGALTLALLFVFYTGDQRVLAVTGVPWVLETLIPLGVLAVGVAIALGQPQQRVRAVGAVLSLIVALALGAFLFSPAAATTFDALRGYYRVVAAPSDAQLALVVRDWTADLEFNNQERTRINQEWLDANAAIERAESDLERANTGVQNSVSIGGDVLTFAKNAQREAERTVRDARLKRAQLERQRASYGVTGADAKLEPLSAVSSATALPRGYSVGRDSAESGVRRVFPESARYGFAALLFFGVLMTLGGAGLAVRGSAALERKDLAGGALLAFVAATLFFGFNAVEFDLGRFIQGFPFIQDFGRRSWPPDFGGILSDGMKALTITVATAMIGTTLAALMALPASFLAARNLTQKSWWGRALYPLVRVFFNVDRGVDTLILALVFVAAVGLGPLAGVLAMAIHSLADLGKLYSEAIENAERGPIEALEASGAPGVSVIRWAVLPQVLPLFVSYTLYRFEINFRVSIILGFVGAGGVGFLIQETMRSGKYDQMIILVTLVVLMVNILDFISATVRRRLVG